MWIVLALASFVCAWFTPLWISLILWVFGAENIAIILAWVVSVLEGRKVMNNEQNSGSDAL